MKPSNDVYNLAFSSFLNTCEDHTPMTVEEAAHTIEIWKEEGNDCDDIQGLTPEALSEAWNQVYYMLYHQS